MNVHSLSNRPSLSPLYLTPLTAGGLLRHARSRLEKADPRSLSTERSLSDRGVRRARFRRTFAPARGCRLSPPYRLSSRSQVAWQGGSIGRGLCAPARETPPTRR